MKISYLVHDLNDPAVARRVRMLLAGGAEVSLAGFWRGERAPSSVGGVPARSLGRSADGRLAQRAGLVARTWIDPGQVADAVADGDVILARNLETLVLAMRVRRRARPPIPVIYECLDVHRLLLGDDLVNRGLRALERRMIEQAALTIVSAPAFAPERRHRAVWAPHILVENKVLELGGTCRTAARRAPPAAPPWRIGWFGMLRCRKSLGLLAELCEAMHGAVEVILRGRPAAHAIPDFDEIVGRTPHLRFEGPYDAAELPGHYGGVHFAWAIDYFEAGLNSAWLLPNRLYEGGLHGAAPLALRDTETGKWLLRRRAGVLLDDPATELAPLFKCLTPFAYARLREAVARIPREDLVADERDCRRLVECIARARAR